VDGEIVVERRRQWTPEAKAALMAERQQHRGKQQECAERQPHPSLGQAGGKRDSSGDRGHSTKRKR
jgi:hypothetical protein